MAKYGSDAIQIEFDDSSGSPQNMTAYVMTFNGLDLQATVESATVFGDSWDENIFTGLKLGADVTLGGLYDDTATTGPDAIFNALGDQRTLKVTWGGTKSTSIETIIKNYKRLPAKGTITKFEVDLSLTGAATEV